jgi:hypothetical protein
MSISHEFGTTWPVITTNNRESIVDRVAAFCGPFEVVTSVGVY